MLIRIIQAGGGVNGGRLTERVPDVQAACNNLEGMLQILADNTRTIFKEDLDSKRTISDYIK